MDKNTKPRTLIDDSLRLHVLESLRLETAKAIADDVELKYECLTLVMLKNADYIYAVDMDVGRSILYALHALVILQRQKGIKQTDDEVFMLAKHLLESQVCSRV